MTDKKSKKPLTFEALQKAVAKAVKKGLTGDIYLPIVFPNAAGVTIEDLWRGKHGKKTKKS